MPWLYSLSDHTFDAFVQTHMETGGGFVSLEPMVRLPVAKLIKKTCDIYFFRTPFGQFICDCLRSCTWSEPSWWYCLVEFSWTVATTASLKDLFGNDKCLAMILCHLCVTSAYLCLFGNLTDIEQFRAWQGWVFCQIWWVIILWWTYGHNP